MKANTLHKPIRSSAGRMIEHAAVFGTRVERNSWHYNPRYGKIRERLDKETKDKETRLAIKEIISAAKEKPQNGVRVGLVRNRGKGKYHVVGLGEILAENFAKLKEIARKEGFTALRMGAITAKL